MCMLNDTLIEKKIEDGKELYKIGIYALSFKKLQGGFENFVRTLKRERRNKFFSSRIALIIAIISLVLSLVQFYHKK